LLEGLPRSGYSNSYLGSLRGLLLIRHEVVFPEGGLDEEELLFDVVEDLVGLPRGP